MSVMESITAKVGEHWEQSTVNTRAKLITVGVTNYVLNS